RGPEVPDEDRPVGPGRREVAAARRERDAANAVRMSGEAGSLQAGGDFIHDNRPVTRSTGNRPGVWRKGEARPVGVGFPRAADELSSRHVPDGKTPTLRDSFTRAPLYGPRAQDRSGHSPSLHRKGNLTAGFTGNWEIADIRPGLAVPQAGDETDSFFCR